MQRNDVYTYIRTSIYRPNIIYIDISDISIYFYMCIYIHIYNHIHILIAAQTTTAKLSSSFLTWFSKDTLGLNSGW